MADSERLAGLTQGPFHVDTMESWLRAEFPDKDWHKHPRTDGQYDLCDGTPSDCAEKVKF